MAKIESFSKKQLKLLTWWYPESRDSGYDAIICDGAVRSGKTVCMSLSFVLWAFARFDGGDFAICGKTIRSVRRNVLVPLMSLLKNQGFICEEKVSANYVDISYHDKKNRFYLFGGRDEGSASLIQGMTLSGVMFDEAALLVRSFVEQALARCSVEGSKFWFNCNPEFPKHWFYTEWIQKRKEKNALYLHFTMQDNPSLSKEMIKRYESLYSGTFYERFVLGKWVAAEGLVYPFMSDITAFCDEPKGGFDEYVVSCDYGTVNPASFGLWGRQSTVWYRIDEYYFDSRREGNQKTDEEHYEGLLKLVGDRNVERITVDPSAASFIELIRRKGKFAVYPAENNVLDGIRRVSTALKQGEINICRACTDIIREFGLYRWDSNGRDAPVKENDHAMDDMRYFVTTLLNKSGGGFFAVSAER